MRRWDFVEAEDPKWEDLVRRRLALGLDDRIDIPLPGSISIENKIIAMKGIYRVAGESENCRVLLQRPWVLRIEERAQSGILAAEDRVS